MSPAHPRQTKVRAILMRATILCSAFVVGMLFALAAIDRYGLPLLMRDQADSARILTAEAWAILTEVPSGDTSRPDALAQAESLFRRAAKLEPEIGRYQLNVARCFSYQQRYEEALPIALEALPRCEPDDPLPHWVLADIHFNLKDWPAAEQSARETIKHDPDDPRPHRMLGHALFLQERDQEAIKTFDHRLESFPAAPADRWGIASLALERGHYETAAGWVAPLIDNPTITAALAAGKPIPAPEREKLREQVRRALNP